APDAPSEGRDQGGHGRGEGANLPSPSGRGVGGEGGKPRTELATPQSEDPDPPADKNGHEPKSTFRMPRSEHLHPLPQNGNGHGHKRPAPGAEVGVAVKLDERIRLARLKGYEGDPCSECGQLTLIRSGACCKCDTCGASSGCG